MALRNLQKKNKGFVIFIAAVVTGILVLIGFLISNIALRQLTFSFAGKNSQIAFVMANSGIECAKFWDLNNQNPGANGQSAFATSSASIAGSITCNDQVFVPFSSMTIEQSAAAATSTFTIEYSDPTLPYCATVDVAKWLTADGVQHTKIESRGHNPCASGPRQLEQAIRVSYP